MDEREIDEEKEIESSLEGIRKLKKTPDLEALQRIPIGKCVSIETDIGNGKIEDVVACRKDEDTWDIEGPQIKSKLRAFDMKKTEQSNDGDGIEEDEAF